jgi:hypothetical protein
LAYFAEHLTAAIVRPGGFGGADDADYLSDTIETLQEFGRFAAQATGGIGFGVSVLLTTFSRLPAGAANRPRRVRTAIVAAATLVVSIAVSCKFFQGALYWPVRGAAFASSDPASGSPSGFWALLPTALRHLLSMAL